VKGFRIFVLVFAASIVFGGGGVWLLWQRYGGAITGELERIERDALVFAAEHEQEDCVPEAFGRLETCDGVWCKAQTPLFTRECLRNAKPSESLCESVPDSLPAALLWSVTTCAEVEAQPVEICERILRELVKVCLPEPF
jgi:hypothetical protein